MNCTGIILIAGTLPEFLHCKNKTEYYQLLRGITEKDNWHDWIMYILTALIETAKRLLSDFRQVEQNFRELDKDTRQAIIKSTLAKGKLLDDIFSK